MVVFCRETHAPLEVCYLCYLALQLSDLTPVTWLNLQGCLCNHRYEPAWFATFDLGDDWGVTPPPEECATPPRPRITPFWAWASRASTITRRPRLQWDHQQCCTASGWLCWFIKMAHSQGQGWSIMVHDSYNVWCLWKTSWQGLTAGIAMVIVEWWV